MKLLNSGNLEISKEKLLDYILSQTHATGKFKAKFFRNLGFNGNNVDLFIDALHNLVRTQEVTDITHSQYGIKYIINGDITAPNGKVVKVKTVWIIEKNSKNPRFVTVYPV